MVARNWVVAVALVKMHRFRKLFLGRPARPSSGLEVEIEGKRGFGEMSGFLDGL